MPSQAFLVSEAIVSIYPTDSDGYADTHNPILVGGAVEGLSIHDGVEEIEDRPTGALYPEIHHGAEQHSFEFDHIWAPNVSGETPISDLTVSSAIAGIVQAKNAVDLNLSPNVHYVVVFVWQDANNPDLWIYRTYYGVTDRTHDIAANGSDSAMSSKKSFRAAYFLT